MIKYVMDEADLRELASLPERLRKNWDNALLSVAGLAQKLTRSVFPKKSGASAASIDAWMEGHNAFVGQRVREPYWALMQDKGYKRHFAPGINAWVGKPKSKEGYYLKPSVDRVMEMPETERKLLEAVDKL